MARGWPLAVLTILVSFGCGGADPPPTDPGPPPLPPPPANEKVLASGRLSLPAASVVGSTGDHEAFALTHRLPADAEALSGQRLILTLRDLTRPGQICASDAPEDGCASIDWSDDPLKPNVPRNGRFENRVTLLLENGSKDFHLSHSGSLEDVPDLIDPSRQHTAIEGRGTRWDGGLPADLVPGSDLQMRLFMTKWLDPSVEIGYEIAVEP